MKLAIGSITTIFGVLLVIYGIINNAAYFIVSDGKTSGMCTKTIKLFFLNLLLQTEN